MRIPHFLRAPKRGAQPSNCLFFDTETDNDVDEAGRQIHRLNFGWAAFQAQRAEGHWTEPTWMRFNEVSAFWDFVELHTYNSKSLYMFAHNGAFDLPVMRAFSELPARGWELKKAVCDAPPIILKWRKGTKTIVFIDTLNIWRMPLSKIGEGYGVPKLPMPAKEASIEEWDRYGKNDCDIIRVAIVGWMAFLRKYDLGPFAHTLASQSLKTFKYRFMKHEIFIDTNERALQIARASYVGGRTECFRIGVLNGPLYYLDVNSMYPAVMKGNDYPVKLRAVYTQPDKEEIDEWALDYMMIGDVDLDVDVGEYPLIQGDKLLFPTGRFRTTLAHPELMRAYKLGHIARWHCVALYEAAPIFSDFVDTMYALRLQATDEGNETERFNLKILANSLYGKFGQRGRRFEECGTTDPNAVWTHTEIDIDSGEMVRYRAFGGLVQAWIDDEESSESHPAIAACVTSYARVVLLNAFERAGRENVMYCDTDSMIVTEQGYSKMRDIIDPRWLGAWKLEKRITRMVINGPKDYDIDGSVKIKGIRATAVRVAHNTYEQDKFVGFRGLLQQGRLDAPIVQRIRKKLRRVYTKGDVLPSGKVLPFHLGRRKRGGGRKRSR
jgi:hypothetical protein